MIFLNYEKKLSKYSIKFEDLRSSGNSKRSLLSFMIFSVLFRLSYHKIKI